ncbi:MAG: hypothetical protein KBT34_04420 [Prevotella sp.]|nr:hypothetical protein [Candidatus Prevotella equi]
MITEAKYTLLKYLRKFHWFKWHEFKLLNKGHLEELYPAYACSNEPCDSYCQEVISIHDKHYETGGLVDRIRGIVSAYHICLQHNIPLKIYWKTPFRLEEFLEPNEVDWTIKDEDICWTKPEAHILSAEISEESMWQERRIRNIICHDIKTIKCKQIHLYSNSRLAYEEGVFVKYYNKLFKPSEKLKAAIEKELALIGKNYITVQCRFVGQLGDFKDNISTVWSDDEQKRLINKLIAEIDSIHSAYNHDMPLLICTDSKKFRKEVLKKLSYAYAIEGDIIHIDYAKGSDDDANMKVFLDLYMMSKASHIYRLATKEMRLSGMPYMASLIGEKPLTDIVIDTI